MTLDQCINEAARMLQRSAAFFGHGTEQYQDDARWLVLHAAGLEDAIADPQRQVDGSRPMQTDELRRLDALLQRRIHERIPVAYLTGYSWFCGLKIELNQDVLIPRSPIAELIEGGFRPWLQPDRVLRALDLCTGSGCIAVAMATLWQDWRVDASDISAAATRVARRNVAAHQLDDRVEILCGDLFAPCRGRQYDLVVTNPPYVARAEYAILPAEYEAEPALGLLAGDDGLDVVLNILRDAADYLTENGILVCEVGHSDAALAAQFPAAPLMWFDFTRGGQGVFMLERDRLLALLPEVEQKISERMDVQ